MSSLTTIEALSLAQKLNAELCNAENAYDVNQLNLTPYRVQYLAILRALLAASLAEADLPADLIKGA